MFSLIDFEAFFHEGLLNKLLCAEKKISHLNVKAKTDLRELQGRKPFGVPNSESPLDHSGRKDKENDCLVLR